MFWLKQIVKKQLGMHKVSWQLSRGLYQLSKLHGPIVSVFGGKGVDRENAYSKHAYDLAGQLVEGGFSILTGGGPGIMAAANCGAFDRAKSLGLKEKRTLGICVRGVDVGFENPCVDVFFTNYFAIRKQLLFRYSCSFVIFPGGIGTVDEFFEVLNLIKVGKMKSVPVILYDSNYWGPLIKWYNYAIEHGFIRPKYQSLFTISDSVDYARTVINAHCSSLKPN